MGDNWIVRIEVGTRQERHFGIKIIGNMQGRRLEVNMVSSVDLFF